MMKKVLVALDGSSRSERSIPWIKVLAKKAEPVLLRVIEPVYALDVYAHAVSSELYDEAKGYLNRIGSRFETKPKRIVSMGPAGPTILDQAHENGADLIAVTTHGGSELGRRIFGGTTEKLIHGSDLPLLVVPSWEDKPAEAKLDTVLVPLDGSEISEKVLPLAVEVARRHDAQLILTHVISDSDEARKRYADLEAHFSKLTKKLAEDWVKSKQVIRNGEADTEIVALAAEAKADLIVMSAHGHGALKRMLVGSVTSKVICHAGIPVVVIRHDALK